MAFIDASHNVLYTLTAQQIQKDLVISGKSDLCGYQEVNSKIRILIKSFCNDMGKGYYAPDNTSNPISWDNDTWTMIAGEEGVKNVHPSGESFGFNRVSPAKDFAYVGLRHKETNKRVLRINVHPLARATDPTPEEPTDFARWCDWGIGQYWLDIVAFTAKQMSRQEKSTSTKSFWQAILLGGDYNGDLLKQSSDEWYYPSQILPGLYSMDPRAGGLDHLQHTHGSDVVVQDRTAKDGNTDHKIQFIKRSFVTKPDFPA